MPRAYSLAVLTITAVLALAGCGGSSSTTTKSPTTGPAPAPASGSPPASARALASRLSALCQQADTAFKAAPSDRAAAGIIAKFVVRVSSLKVPPQLQGTFSQYLSVIKQELKDLERGNEKAVFQLAKTKARPLAKKLGATGCVS